MQIITFKIETEVELARVTSLFEERGIPYTVKRNSDLFPYNGDRRPLAEILVLREFEKEALAILDEIEINTNVARNEGDPDAGGKADNQKTGKRQRLWQSILIVYSLVTTILLIKYWDMNRKNSDAKNFKYAWNLSNTDLSMRYKKSQQLIQIFRDANYDLNFEKVETFSKNNSVMTSLSQDFDEDGFFDEITYYGKNGKIAGGAIDLDSDGWIEESIVILENGDTLKLTDKNQDGFFVLEK
jgi:hypothetical protein